MNHYAAQPRFRLPRHVQERVVLIATLLAASLSIAITASLWGASTASTGEISAKRPVEAVFTGAFEHGVPVYRLPTITVSAKRNVELARRGADVRREQRVRRDEAVVTGGAGRNPS